MRACSVSSPICMSHSGNRLRDAYVQRLGIDPDDVTDLRPQILVGLYLSLAAEVSERSRPTEETRRLWLASLRSLL